MSLVLFVLQHFRLFHRKIASTISFHCFKTSVQFGRALHSPEALAAALGSVCWGHAANEFAFMMLAI